MIEKIGTLALVLGVTGVLLNNRKDRACYIVWIVANILSAIVHINTGIESLLIRDAIFTILCIEGWFKWGKKKND